MTVAGAAEFVEVPEDGRTFRARRRVGLGDVTIGGRVRLDALARYLQDVAADDLADVARPEDTRGTAWIVRRTALRSRGTLRLGEEVELTTFCSGEGPSWAERRTRIVGDAGAVIDAVALWVFVSISSGRPLRLPPLFHAHWSPAAGGRRIRARLRHEDAPADADRRRWPTRVSDFDVVGHLNNAVYWDAVEDELARRRLDALPTSAEIEYRGGIDPGEPVELAVADSSDGFALWHVVAGDVRASARVAR